MCQNERELEQSPTRRRLAFTWPRRGSKCSVKEQPSAIRDTRSGISVTPPSSLRLHQRQSGNLRPGPLGGDRRSAAIEAHASLILRTFEARRDMSIEELRVELASQGVRFGYGTLWRFFARHRLTRKKRRRTPPSRTGRMC
jgi:hypothetical protein